MKNPLIDFPTSPFGTLNFNEIQPEHFMPAAEHWMEISRARQLDITSNTDAATFKNTVAALEFASLELGVVTSCFFNLNSAETNESIQEIARELSPKLTAFNNETLLNEALFERIKTVWEQRDNEKLDAESQRLLKETYEGFVRNGAMLEGEDREQLKSLSEALSKASLTFGENVLKETQEFQYHTEEKGILEGLPEGVLEQAKSAAAEKNKDGYVLGLDMPTYISIMKYALNRELRAEFYRAYASRAAKDNANNNEAIIQELVNKRRAKAQLLGFDSHAELTLSKRMAKTPQTVLSFLTDLREVSKPAAQADLKRVQEFAKAEGAEYDIQPWDFSFWSERLKKATLDLDDELLKPYFQLDDVLNGAFEVSRRLYGLEFVANESIQGYHEEVRAFEVRNANGEFVSVLYTDFFPRPGKRAGAWMTSYRSMYKQESEEVRPHISIVCNFTRPTGSKSCVWLVASFSKWPTLPSNGSFIECQAISRNPKLSWRNVA